MIDLKQLKKDFDRGVLLSRCTVAEMIEALVALQPSRNPAAHDWAAPASAPDSIQLGHGAELRREKRHKNTHGWLMYNEHGLVRALNGAESMLVNSALAAAPVPPVAPDRQALTECRHCGFFVALNQPPADAIAQPDTAAIRDSALEEAAQICTSMESMDEYAAAALSNATDEIRDLKSTSQTNKEG